MRDTVHSSFAKYAASCVALGVSLGMHSVGFAAASVQLQTARQGLSVFESVLRMRLAAIDVESAPSVDAMPRQLVCPETVPTAASPVVAPVPRQVAIRASAGAGLVRAIGNSQNDPQPSAVAAPNAPDVGVAPSVVTSSAGEESMLSSDTGSATSAKLVGNGNGRSSGTASATRDASAGDGRAIFEYGRLVHAKISTAVVFPERAEREKLQGTVMLRVVLDGEGALRTVIALNSDAEPVLRDAALSAARRASPFPPPPVRFVSAERTLAFTVPLRFFFRK